MITICWAYTQKLILLVQAFVRLFQNVDSYWPNFNPLISNSTLCTSVRLKVRSECLRIQQLLFFLYFRREIERTGSVLRNLQRRGGGILPQGAQSYSNQQFIRVNKLSFVEEANALCSCLVANDFNEIISFHLVKICYWGFKKGRRESCKAP